MSNTKNMLSQEAQAYKLFITQGFPMSSTFDVDSVRQKNERLHALLNKQFIQAFNVSTKDELISIDSTEIPISIYTPADVSNKNIVIYFHGGGWIFGSRTTHQTIVQMAAQATKSVWISVEYRLAPEHKFPVWLDDSVSVVEHIIANKTDYGGDASSKIGVAGDSAGAITAASISVSLQDKIGFQILVYGSFDRVGNGEPTCSEREFDSDPFLARSGQVKWVLTNAFRDPEVEASDSRISIINNDKSLFKNLPPTLFIVAEVDPARDDSYVYHSILKEAGVDSELYLVKGVLHTFFSLPGLYRQACAEAVNVIKAFLSRISTHDQ